MAEPDFVGWKILSTGVTLPPAAEREMPGSGVASPLRWNEVEKEAWWNARLAISLKNELHVASW
jgi:hypothetical protein